MCTHSQALAKVRAEEEDLAARMAYETRAEFEKEEASRHGESMLASVSDHHGCPHRCPTCLCHPHSHMLTHACALSAHDGRMML